MESIQKQLTLGECQWVTPGIITRSISAITSVQVSGFSGAFSGINGRRYPGVTDGRTCL